jgi:Fe-S-cluster containining protein
MSKNNSSPAQKDSVLEVKTRLECDQSVILLLKALFSLSIKCQTCAKCCDGSFFKDVPLLGDDIKAIAEKTGWSLSQIKKVCHCNKNGDKLFLSIAQPCPFLVSGRCSIYDVRPTICRLFPVIIHDNILKINISCPAGENIFEKLMSFTNNNTYRHIAK